MNMSPKPCDMLGYVLPTLKNPTSVKQFVCSPRGVMKIKSAISAASILVSFVFAGSIRAAVLAQYTFGTSSSATLEATTVDLNVTATPFAGVGTFAGDTFVTTIGNPASSFRLTYPPKVETAADYVSFTVTAKPGHVLNLNGGTLTIQHDVASDSAHWAVRSSVDGYTANIATGKLRRGWTTETATLPATDYGDLSSILFEIFEWEESDGKTIYADNVTLNGVVAVPEVEAIGIVMGLLAIGVVVARHWRFGLKTAV